MSREQDQDWDKIPYDNINLSLVMNIIVTCSNPQAMDQSDVRQTESKDGIREEFWPIIGGRFWGDGIHGVVVGGGSDFPLIRPDGVEIIDAFHRLRSHDGQTIIIHNRGMTYQSHETDTRYRLVPEFTAPRGKYDWLNKSIFLSTLVDPVPEHMKMAADESQNDRLIQVWRVG